VTSGAVRSPATRVRSRVATVLLPLLALLAGAGIAAALLQALSDPQPASTASAAEQRSNGSIVLNSDDYIGRPVQEVTERLTALGLDVELREEITEDAVPDRVTGVEPTGTSLAPGDRVIVRYAVAPPVTGRSSGGGSAVTGASVDGDAAPTEQGAASGGTSTTDSGDPGAAPPTGTMEASPTGSSASETTSTPTTPTPSETAPTTSEPTTTTPTESDETDD
jgi:eukaryotic-like serine/threonine-protein kinase